MSIVIPSTVKLWSNGIGPARLWADRLGIARAEFGGLIEVWFQEDNETVLCYPHELIPTVTTQRPTNYINILSERSTGFEPVFSSSYDRTVLERYAEKDIELTLALYEALGPVPIPWDTVPDDFSDLWKTDDSHDFEMPGFPDYMIQAEARSQLGALIKVWHDDLRHPPDDSWIHVRTNEEALDLLHDFDVDVISLDHDLGGSRLPLGGAGQHDYVAMTDPDGQTGVELVYEMCLHDIVPPKVIIHSMNSVGAQNMSNMFKDMSFRVTRPSTVTVEPFSR